jgi:hypothetical protein
MRFHFKLWVNCTDFNLCSPTSMTRLKSFVGARRLMIQMNTPPECSGTSCVSKQIFETRISHFSFKG